MPTIAPPHPARWRSGLHRTFPTPRRQDGRSRQDCLPFAPPARIIGGETLKAGKMGNDHGMAVGVGGFRENFTPFNRTASTTPRCVVQLIVETAPGRKCLARDVSSRIYDPVCGTGGMFVQSEKFVEAHGGTTQRDSSSSPRNPGLRSLAGRRGDSSKYGLNANA